MSAKEQRSCNNQKEPVNYSKEKGDRKKKEKKSKRSVLTSTGKKYQPRNDFPVALVTSSKRMSVEGFQTASSPCGSSPKRHPKIDSGTPPGHLIAYVYEVTSLKRNRSNTLDYFNLTLQCSSANYRRICFSRAKRQLFVERQESKTAVKLQRLILAKDGETIFMNDMTKVSSPNSSEYNFQYQDIDYPIFDSLTAVVENAVDMEQVKSYYKM